MQIHSLKPRAVGKHALIGLLGIRVTTPAGEAELGLRAPRGGRALFRKIPLSHRCLPRSAEPQLHFGKTHITHPVSSHLQQTASDAHSDSNKSAARPKSAALRPLPQVTSLQKPLYSLAYHEEWRHIAPPIFLKPTRVRPQAPRVRKRKWERKRKLSP